MRPTEHDCLHPGERYQPLRQGGYQFALCRRELVQNQVLRGLADESQLLKQRGATAAHPTYRLGKPMMLYEVAFQCSIAYDVLIEHSSVDATSMRPARTARAIYTRFKPGSN